MSLKNSTGIIRPFVLALLLIVCGLIFNQWWWQIGVLIMIILFVEASLRYRGIR